MQLTKDFSIDEMKCRCGKCDGGQMSMEFMLKLQAVRDAYGKAMPVSSGFRCPERNTSEGGSQNSMHMKGRAVDIACDNGTDKIHLLLFAVSAGMNGFGIAKNFIHMDDRETQTIWTY